MQDFSLSQLIDPALYENDPTYNWLQIIFPGALGASSATVMGQMFFAFNACVALIGAFFVTYNIATSVVSAAHDGEVFGKNWGNIWSVVRTGFGMGSLAPVVGGGYSLIQFIVIKIAVLGIACANIIWATATGALILGGSPIIQPQVPPTRDVARATLSTLTCMYIVNEYYNQANPNNTFLVAPSAPIVSGANSTILYQASGMGPLALCGSVSYNQPTAQDINGAGNISTLTTTGAGTATAATMAQISDYSSFGSASDPTKATNGLAAQYASRAVGIRLSQISAHSALMSGQLDSLAAAIATAVLNTQQPATYPDPSAFTSALNAYNQQLWNNLGSVRSGSGGANSGETQLASLMAADGWSSAGSYYMAMSKINAQLMAAAGALPTITPPSLDAAGGLPVDDVRHLTHLYQLAQTWIDQTLMTSSSANIGANSASSNNAAAANVAPAATPTPSYYSDIALSASDGYLDLDDPPKAPTTGGNASLDVVHEILKTSRWKRMLQAADPSSGNGWQNPMMALVTLGTNIVSTLGAIYVSVIGFSSTTLGTAAIGSSVSFAGFSINAGPLIAFVSFIFSLVSPIIIPVFFVLLSAGLFLEFVLPMMPYLMWTSCVIGWLILVVEGVIAAPLWGFAHLRMDGEDFAGGAKPGYEIMFNLALRPMLMLFGLFCSYAVFMIGAQFVSQTFFTAAAGTIGDDLDPTALCGFAALMLVLVSLVVVLIEKSFGLIHEIPDKVMAYAGLSSQMRGEGDRHDAALAYFRGGAKAYQGASLPGRKKKGPETPGGGGGGGGTKKPSDSMVKGMSQAGSGASSGAGAQARSNDDKQI